MSDIIRILNKDNIETRQQMSAQLELAGLMDEFRRIFLL